MKKHDGTALKKSVRIICEDDKGQGKVLKEKDQQQRKPPASPPPTSSQDGSKPRRKSSLEIVHKLQKGTPPPAAQAAAAPMIAAETGIADANTPVTVIEAADAAASSATAAITSSAAADHSDKEPAVLASHTAAFETALAPSITNSRTPRASTDMLDSSNISTATASMSSAGDAVTATAGSSKDDAVPRECTTSTLPAVEVSTVDDVKADAIVAATCTVTPKRPSVGQEMLAKRNTFANFSRTVKPRYAPLI
eukprot:10058-Heterococcus_DN1.PRE.2